MAHITNNSNELDDSCVRVYQNMLNRHFHFKTIFIFDSELVDMIREAYNFVGSPRNSHENGNASEAVQEIFAEIHRRIDGNFLSDYKRLLFTVQSTFDGRLDFVEADLGNSEMKGKEQDVALFQAFFQDYLH